MKTLINSALSRFGARLVGIPRTALPPGYEPIFPSSTYSPWTEDQEFESVYQKISDHTLIDKYRLWELWSLLDQVKEIPGAMIEVGVWRGGSAELIASKAKLLGIQENLYLCDTFEGIVKTTSKDTSYKDGVHNDVQFSNVVSLLAHHDSENTKILKGIFPDETSEQVLDDQFRFAHIDVDVYQSAKDVTEWLWDRLASNGIVVFDDYGFNTCKGIREFVDEWRHHHNCHFIHNLNGHAILIKN